MGLTIWNSENTGRKAQVIRQCLMLGLIKIIKVAPNFMVVEGMIGAIESIQRAEC